MDMCSSATFGARRKLVSFTTTFSGLKRGLTLIQSSRAYGMATKIISFMFFPKSTIYLLPVFHATSKNPRKIPMRKAGRSSGKFQFKHFSQWLKKLFLVHRHLYYKNKQPFSKDED